MKIDRELRADVQNELEWDPSVDARSIGVDVQDGIVTLNGFVRTFSCIRPNGWSSPAAMPGLERQRFRVNLTPLSLRPSRAVEKSRSRVHNC